MQITSVININSIYNLTLSEQDKKILLTSLTHKSFSPIDNNEKLEFLGDNLCTTGRQRGAESEITNDKMSEGANESKDVQAPRGYCLLSQLAVSLFQFTATFK